jgi:tetratricopeptide (TPR) repeat protein
MTSPFFSADGRWLISSGGQCWRVDDWSEGPRHIGGEAAFTADKRLMAWGGQKGFVPLVDPESGRELARLEDPFQDGLAWITFSPDGTLLIGSTDDSSCVRVWNLRKIRDGLKVLDLDWAAEPYPPETAEQPLKPIHIELVGAEKLIAPAEPPGLALNNEAWRLVTGPSEERNPAKALDLVRQALDREPGNRLYLNTLGVAEYRSGRYTEAIIALNKSLAGGGGDYDGFDLYFLAMCHLRLGDVDKARDSFDRAVNWHDKKVGLSAIHATELNEFRVEAKTTLESNQSPAPPPVDGKH